MFYNIVFVNIIWQNKQFIKNIYRCSCIMIIEIEEINDARISVYSGLTEAQLRCRLHPDDGIFIAESPKVIRVALQAGYEPLSLLCERCHIAGDTSAANDNVLDNFDQIIESYSNDKKIITQLL